MVKSATPTGTRTANAPSAAARPYHHGNVRAEVLAAAVAAIAEHGPSALSMRDLARRVGITHGAAAHHFGDKTGLLTAVAADGYRRLTHALQTTWDETGDFGAVGVAYVQFAVDHPAHFDVMFRPDLYRADDADLLEAKAASGAVLYQSAAQVADAAGDDHQQAGIAAWAYVHGIATLWRDGNLPPPFADDPVGLTRQIGPLLFQRSRAARRRPRPPRRGAT